MERVINAKVAKELVVSALKSVQIYSNSTTNSIRSDQTKQLIINVKTSFGIVTDIFLEENTSNTLSKYSGDLISELVWYSYLNGPKQFASWMVCYSGHGLNNKLIVRYSGQSVFDW